MMPAATVAALLPDAGGFDPAGKPTMLRSGSLAPGELVAFPNLWVIFNLGAGVDALMADSSLPKVPLVRVGGRRPHRPG